MKLLRLKDYHLCKRCGMPKSRRKTGAPASCRWCSGDRVRGLTGKFHPMRKRLTRTDGGR